MSLQLYSVTVTNVYPEQCVTVTDDSTRAQKLSEFLNNNVSNNTYVKPVDSFFPAGMTDCDDVWRNFTHKFYEQEKN